MEEIMEFGAYHAGIRVLLKCFDQPFYQTVCEFRIVIHQEQETAGSSFDTQVIATGETQVLFTPDHFNKGPNVQKCRGGVFPGSVVHHDHFDIMVAIYFEGSQ
ncbi:hypothetical protein D9M70_648360 [compost metagenome]